MKKERGHMASRTTISRTEARDWFPESQKIHDEKGRAIYLTDRGIRHMNRGIPVELLTESEHYHVVPEVEEYRSGRLRWYDSLAALARGILYFVMFVIVIGSIIVVVGILGG